MYVIITDSRDPSKTQFVEVADDFPISEFNLNFAGYAAGTLRSYIYGANWAWKHAKKIFEGSS